MNPTGRLFLVLMLPFLTDGCVWRTIPTREIASLRVGGILGEDNKPLTNTNAEIKSVLLEMQPILERHGFNLFYSPPATARFRTSIGYEACYYLSHGQSTSLFRCQIDGDRERFVIQFIEVPTVASHTFTMTPKDQELIRDTVRQLRECLQLRFPNRKVHVSFTTYE